MNSFRQGHRVQVLSNIVDRVVAFVDHAAGRWLYRLGHDRCTSAAGVTVVRRLTGASGAALLVVPAGLCMFVSPAVALPIAVALIGACFLIGFVAFTRMPRRPERDIAPADAPGDMLDHCSGLILMLTPQGRIIRITGRDRATFSAIGATSEGASLTDKLHVVDRVVFAHALDMLRQGHDQACVDVRIQRPLCAEGPQFQHVHIDLSAIRDADGGLEQVMTQIRDISGEQTLHAQATEKAEQAQSANDAKSRFLAAVSHELRTPLNAILGFSDILIGEYFGRLENDRQREYVKLIRQSGAHLLSVVNTMLDMSKIEAGRYELFMEAFPVTESISACEAMLGLQAREKGVTLTSRVPRGTGEVIADQRAIQQILINLAGNAIKFTDAGGIVTLEAAIVGQDLRICVSDTGIGIASNRIETLGQPFVQIQNAHNRHYEGTGLGLSLVKGLVGLHGGTFAIASRPGEGTVVTVTVPADGSGVCLPQDQPQSDTMVEFPPRLKGPVADRNIQKEDVAHGTAKAKSA